MPAIKSISNKLIDASDYLGNSPIHYASKNGNLQTLEVLVNYGCNINKQDKNGNTGIY
jgi:ankyrin repeat protein